MDYGDGKPKVFTDNKIKPFEPTGPSKDVADDTDTKEKQIKKPSTIFGTIFGAATDLLKKVPFIGDFIQGFEEGFKKTATPGSNSEALLDAIYGSGDSNAPSGIEPSTIESIIQETKETTPGSVSPLPPDLHDKAKMMHDYIVTKGYTTAQAKGIVANIQRESTFRPGIKSVEMTKVPVVYSNGRVLGRHRRLPN